MLKANSELSPSPIEAVPRLKFAIPITIVSFFILETALFGLAGVYLPRKIRGIEAQKPLHQANLSAFFSESRDQKLELLWNHGQNKKSIPLTDLAIPFYREYTHKEDWRIDLHKLETILTTLAQEIDQDPINAKLEFAEDERRIKEFSLPQSGLSLNLQKSVNQVVSGLVRKQLAISLAIDETAPTITAASVQKLGIDTLLGRGESNFSGSSSSRIVNIKIGASKFHGLLIGPGEEFSFNTVLGEVDNTTGYEPEFVIKNNQPVLEYGGGLCQVSTTLFRAAIYAGLPILERRPHSFPVRYYNPQGFDATIYPGQVDLRFKNDTPGYILIQNKIVGNQIVFELYGTSDDRRVSLDGPYQYNQQASGALKAYFSRKISLLDGSEKIDKFSSIYRPAPASHLEKNPLE